MKHTLGPWFLNKTPYGCPAVSTEEGMPYHGRICYMGREHAEWKANARLIAASPTMFDFILRKAYDGDEDARRIVGGIDEGYTWPGKQETT